MKTFPTTVTLLAALALAPAGFSYSAPGHQAIGKVASELLEDDDVTVGHIRNILGTPDLDTVAVWADWIRLKEYKYTTDAEIADIETRYPKSDNWHFANLPLGTKNYGVDYPADTVNEDVVIGINTCINILETPDTSPKHDAHQIALKFLVHLVGDIHQPFHVGCGYYRLGPGNKATLVKDPSVVLAEHLLHDRGGNKLLYTESENLHHYWDDYLVEHLDPGKTLNTYLDVAEYLSAHIKDPTAWKTPGDYHTWAAAWATESAHVAAESVYKGFKVATAEPDDSPKHQGEIAETMVTKFNPDTYLRTHRETEKTQMIKAACRLADLLRHIQWAD